MLELSIYLSIYLSFVIDPARPTQLLVLSKSCSMVSLLVDIIGESLVGYGIVVHHLLSSGTREKGRRPIL